MRNNVEFSVSVFGSAYKLILDIMERADPDEVISKIKTEIVNKLSMPTCYHIFFYFKNSLPLL